MIGRKSALSLLSKSGGHKLFKAGTDIRVYMFPEPLEANSGHQTRDSLVFGNNLYKDDEKIVRPKYMCLALFILYANQAVTAFLHFLVCEMCVFTVLS